MQGRIILDNKQLSLTLHRLCVQLIENHRNLDKTVLIGVQPRGIFLLERLINILDKEYGFKYKSGILDISFYRDDFRTSDKPLKVNETRINESLEGKYIVLVDDVLFTGRTIRAALDSLLDFGRPADVELLVLIDRRLQRHVPIQAKYVGKTIDSIISEKVLVEWGINDKDSKVWLNASKTKE